MVAERAARAGIPLSVKLIVATSVVVAVAVGMSTLYADRTITALTDAQIEARRVTGEAAIMRASELVAEAVASTVALPVGGNTFSDVKPVLDSAVAADRDQRVRWLVVRLDNDEVVAQTAGAPDAAGLAHARDLLKQGEHRNEVVHVKTGATDWVYGVEIKLGHSMVGHLHMGVSTAGLERDLVQSLDDAREVARKSRSRALLVSLVVLVLGIGLAALYGSRIARPIKALTLQAQRIASGDLHGRVAIDRRDELGVLAHTFNAMSDQIRLLLIEQTQKASLEKEMSLARQVQQAMLPPEVLDHHGPLKVVGYCMPASSCGGDWWTYRKLSGDRMLIVVGDATGHGMHSAMIAATARGAVEALSSIDERLLTPEQVLRAIDSGIRQVGDNNVLMTAFAALFESTTGALYYANAGQNFPYVMRLGAERVLGEPSIIAASGNPLGDRTIAVEIRCGQLQLQPGDLFVCFTDGVVERVNPAGKLFGDRRLRRALIGESLIDDDALVALRDRIILSIEHYADGAIAQDDITLVLCQFDPEPPRQAVRRGAA